MTKSIPTIQEFMTAVPVCIESTAPITRAQEVLREHGIRHLPVLGAGGAFVGLVTDRDLKLVLSMTMQAAEVAVTEVMRSNVLTVEPTASLEEVVSEMAEGKHGSAVVVKNRKVIGIFTTVDACRALATVLRG